MAAGTQDRGQTVGLSLHTCTEEPAGAGLVSSRIGLLSHPPLPSPESLTLTRDTGYPRQDLSGVRPRATGWPHPAQPACPIIPTCPGRAPLADLFPVHEMAKAQLFGSPCPYNSEQPRAPSPPGREGLQFRVEGGHHR